MIDEVFNSPEGDPARQGRILFEQSLGAAAGPIQLVPAPDNHELRRTTPSLLAARRSTELLLAADLEVGVGSFFEDDAEARRLTEAIRDHDRRA
jgi:hypothetical protein